MIAIEKENLEIVQLLMSDDRIAINKRTIFK